MRIAVWARHARGGGPSLTAEVVRLLREWDIEVDVRYGDPGEPATPDRVVEHDLYVLRSVTASTVDLAARLEAAGARTVNSSVVSRLCRDKLAVADLLERTGVPAPQTWSVEPAAPGEPDPPTRLETLLEEGPLVVKPRYGSRGLGVAVVRCPRDLSVLAAAPGPAGGVPLVAQRFHPPQGPDRKVYCLGGQLFGVLRTWPARTYEDKRGVAFTVDDELCGLARRVTAALGTDLFGMDVVVSDDRPVVVDVNPFPGFKGVPDAALRLADYLYARARGDVPTRAGAAGATRSDAAVDQEVS